LLDLKRFDSGQLRQAASSEGCRSVVAHEGRQVFGLKLRVPGTRLVELQSERGDCPGPDSRERVAFAPGEVEAGVAGGGFRIAKER
jgi:hypothetical protein